MFFFVTAIIRDFGNILFFLKLAITAFFFINSLVALGCYLGNIRTSGLLTYDEAIILLFLPFSSSLVSLFLFFLSLFKGFWLANWQKIDFGLWWGYGFWLSRLLVTRVNIYLYWMLTFWTPLIKMVIAINMSFGLNLIWCTHQVVLWHLLLANFINS